MAFDPDAYLARSPAAAAPPKFDPDAYLRATSSGVPTGRRGVDQIPGYGGPVPAAPQAAPQGYGGPLPEALMAPIETAVALGTSAVTAPIVEFAKIGGTLTSGKFGTQAGIRAGEATGRKVQQFFQPTLSPTAQAQVESIGNALASTGLQGVPLNMMGNMATLARPAVQQVAPAIKAPIEARQQRVQAERVRQSELNAPRIDAVKDALDLGLALDPALSNPNAVTRIKSGAVGSTGLQGNLSKLNLPKIAARAREDMGLPETIKLDAKAFDTALEAPAISVPYNKVSTIPRINADDAVIRDINNLKVTPAIGDTGQAAAVNNFIDTVQGQLQGGAPGATVLDGIRQLRRDAQAVYNQQSVGINPPSPGAIAIADVNMGIARALETAIENSITDPMLVADFRNARALAGRINDYRRATNLATGVVNPQELAKLAAEGRPLSGNIAKIANVAANFPENMQGGVVREPTFREKATRSGAAGTVGAVLGSPFGLPGAVIGGGVGGVTGNIASALMARRMASPAYQRANAMPPDYRPVPSGLRPVEPNATPNALMPYDYSQQSFAPPNFVIPQGVYGEPAAMVSPLARELPAPSAQGTMAGLRTEDARRAAMSRTLGQQAEAQQAAAEAAARRPTSREVILDINPLTGVPEISTGLRGATPATFQDFGSSLKSAADKATAGRMFDMTAAEKVAWNKTKVDLAEVVPGFKALDDKAIAAKTMDRAWVQNTIAKANEKARAFEQIAARANTERARQAAIADRERMLDLVADLEERLSAPRPDTSRRQQGPKTRAAKRNALAPDNQNNLAP
jgi:hypothetical protein